MRRRDLLRSAPFARSRAQGRARGQAGAREESIAGMNVILFLTDQERAIQHFPSGWEEENLPGMTRLRRHGLSFDRAFCSSCMCSPSRASLFTGYFPAQHGVTDTLSFGHALLRRTSASCPADLPNMATVFAAAGYEVAYKGKWHLSKPLRDPDDAEAGSRPSRHLRLRPLEPARRGREPGHRQFGGGDADNDGRIMDS